MTEVPLSPPLQTPPDPSRAARLVPEIRLANIRLLEARCNFVPLATIPPAPYTFQTQVGVAWQRRDDGFGFAVRVDVQAGPENQPNEPFWTCTAIQELVYLIPEPNRFEDDEAIAFGTTTGVFAAWPYLREVVQSLSSRAGLNPIVLDVLRAGTPLSAAVMENDRAEAPESVTIE